MSENARSRKTFYFILVLILLAVNAFLFYTSFNQKKLSEQLELQKQEAEVEVTRLNDEIKKYIYQLDDFKGENTALAEVRDSLKQVILVKQKEIQRKINSNSFTTKKLKETEGILAQARSEIDALIGEKNSYLAQVDSISTAYAALQSDYQELGTRYTESVAKGAVLESNLDSISSLGSILTAVKVAGLGVRSRNNGEEADASRAKRAEKIKICFDLLQNRLIDEGQQTLHLKIIGPNGTTLNGPNSGTFTDRTNGEESMYTTRYDFQFANKPSQRFCTYWGDNSGPEFQAGSYVAELYHKGYKVGNAGFELK